MIPENSLYPDFNLDSDSAKTAEPPLILTGVSSDSNTPIALWKGESVSRTQFFSHIMNLSERLHEGKHVINLCEDKYFFAVSFLAALVRQQANLLPLNRTPAVIAELTKEYPSAYIIADHFDANLSPNSFIIDDLHSEITSAQPPLINSSQIAAYAFSSGSTGKPKPVTRTWEQLKCAALLAINRFNLAKAPQMLVSTVPPQHMYGLETSFLWPLFSASFFHSGQPFFPEDIRQTVNSAPQACMLISTPAHLKACVRSRLDWHNIACVLSATAPMSSKLAKQVESRFDAPLFEIFGSTETFSFASRQPARQRFWRPYNTTRVFTTEEASYLHVAHFQEAIRLDDLLKTQENGTFSVQGRSHDLVKVAGKRMSLAALNDYLQQIVGVEDGIFFVPENQTETERLSALVVSSLTKTEIFKQLKRSMDEVFLPRPLYRVKAIPRNNLGKINREKLELLLKELRVGKNP